MRTWISAVCMLFAAVVCCGEEDTLGPADFALGDGTPRTSVEEYYANENRSILKIYEYDKDKDEGTWKDARVTKDSAGKSVLEIRDGNGRWEVRKDVSLANDAYVISHGLNDTYGSGWITKSANAIVDKNPNAIILSVNWDHYSGTESNIKDSNFGASSWINSVSSVLAGSLGEFNIKSCVGHSYGAHLLADTMVKMYGDGTGRSDVSFVALDPAEETLTYTGEKKDGSPTSMWSDNKKSKDWGLPKNVISEVYKSSGFLGSEEKLGDYNYFLAAEETITPRGVLGDLDAGNKKMDYSDLSAKDKKGLSNHSLAPAWFAEMLANGHFDGDKLGGWFNSETTGDLATRKGRERGNKEWDGVVNATSSVKRTDENGNTVTPTLEYNATTDNNKKNPVKTWQELCDAEARDRLEKGLKWEDSVLKPYKKFGYEVKENVQNIFSRTKTTQDVFADMSGSGGSQYGKATQTSDGEAPANILNATFADGSAEPKDAQTLANEAFDKEINKIVKDVADGDQSLAQKIKDYVNGKLEEAIKKGGDWIENGGIRKTILEQVDKMIEGKVSSEDAQRIHNLVDTLCNVNEDGGESFCNTLGTDGKDLAVSLAVEALKKQLSDALPEDAADMVNAMLDVLKDKGTADDYKKAVLGQIQELITKYVPYENTANTLNGIIQNISDGNAIDVMDSIKDVGKNLGVDLLKDTISKNLDPELANRINALLDGFAKDGIQGVTDEALSQIYGLIDKYAPGADSAQKLKDLIKGTFNGTVTAPDFRNTATSIVADGARNLINNSNLPQGVKDAANTAVDGLMQNGVTGMTTNVRDFISDYVSDYLGDDAAGDAVGKIFDAVVTPGVDPWQEIVTQAPVIGAAIGHKVVAEVEKLAAAQIDKLIAKCPALQKVLNKLGINGAGIINGIKNVFSVLKNAPDLKTALTKLGDMAVNFLKDIAGKLIDWALEWAISWINNNIIPKVIDWASETLGKMADSTNNELLQKGLACLADQVKNCKKCAAIKIKVDGTGAKIVNKVDQWIKSKQSTSTTVLQSNGGSK